MLEEISNETHNMCIEYHCHHFKNIVFRVMHPQNGPTIQQKLHPAKRIEIDSCLLWNQLTIPTLDNDFESIQDRL